MEAFEEVYRRHLPSVFRYAVRLVGRRDVAEELASEAFVSLWRDFRRLDHEQLPGWLFVVVKNRATDYWRRSGVEERYLATLEAGPQAALDRAAFDDWLDAVPALKPVHRAVLILRYLHGFERVEIASRLGLSETQVKGYLQYAHRLLRRELVAQA